MKKWFLIYITVLLVLPTQAQKIKYKDLFPLLEAKNYDQAEPQLRIFLSEEKNADEANAHYQYALLMEKYFQEGDILLDTSSTSAYADTTIAFYRLAKGLITEKELKKNDQYYQSFYRRDLRTGDFGIKISDVHLDIEKRIEAVELRRQQTRELHQRLASIKETENSMIMAYNNLVTSYESYYDFILKADFEEISALGTLADFQFLMITKSKEIKETATTLGLEGQYESLEFQPLASEFTGVIGIMTTLDGTLETYDIDEWVGKAKLDINGDISYLKRLFQTTDEQLVKGKEDLLKGDWRANFPTEVPEDMIQLSEKYDPDNGPTDLVAARINENIIIALSDTVISKDWTDSLKIAYHVETCDSIKGHLGEMTALLSGLGDKLSNSTTYYSKFFTSRYENLDGAIAYVNDLAKWTDDQIVKWDTVSAFWDMRNNWGISETDTISLNPVDTSFTGDYFTLGKWVVDDYDVISYGVKKDSLLGFIARFGPDRKMKWETRFESTLFEGRIDQRFEQDTLIAGEEDIAFFLFDPIGSGRHNMTVVSFSLEGNTNWSVSVNAEQKPVYSTYSSGIKQHTIFLHPQEAYPLPDGRLGYIVIDQNGEAK